MWIDRITMEEYSPNRRILDFDLHGIVGVRFVNPTDSDALALTNQLGAMQASLGGEPDIVVHFKEHLSPPSVKYLGLNSAAYTDEGFYLLGRKSGEVEARIPFDRIGDPCEISCQSGLGSVPLLFDVVRFTALKKNYVPVHASAFLHNGVGVLVTGWTKGGKTEALLSFANHGAHYVGDEWVLLSSDGRMMFGMPINLAIWDWQFKHIPDILPRISMQKRILFKSIHFLEAIHALLECRRLGRFYLVELLEQALPFLRRGLKIREPPQAVFGNRVSRLGTTPDILLLMISHSESNIRVEPCDPMEIARRMANSNECEQMPFFEYYKAFKFAFPHLSNAFLEKADEMQSSLLRHALEGKEAYMVFHPYPVAFEALFDELKPVCESKR